MYARSSLLISTGSASAAAIQAWMAKRGVGYADWLGVPYAAPPLDLGAAIVAEAAAVGLNADLVTAQICHETAAWQSEYALERNNPGGIGAINSDPDQALRFPSVQAGIRAHVAHLANYVHGKGVWSEDDPRGLPDAFYGVVAALSDLEQRWAWSRPVEYDATPPGKRYGGMIAALANDLVAFADKWNQEPSMAAPEIVRNILPWQASNTPGKTMVWDSVTVHNTGNPSPGADAIMHGRWLQNLAKAGASEPSWQYTVDDTRIVQHLEDTQAGWHASDGDGPGNMKSLGFELCEIGDQDKVLRNAAWIIARKLHSKDYGSDRVFQHYDRARDKKNCPRLLRANNGAGWKKLLSLIDAELAALGGGSAPAPDKWVIPGNPYGDYGFVAGFRATVEALAKAKYPADVNASALSIVGYPLRDEHPIATGAAQVCERAILLYDRNAAPPFDVTLSHRTAGIPPRRDDE